jgi:hypothetical protein
MRDNAIRLVLFVALLLIGPRALAHRFSQPQQDKAKETKTSPEAEMQKQQKQQQVLRILAVLRATGDGAKDWNDVAAASKTQAQIADLMWDFDAEAGRYYLIKAWETARRIDYPKQQERSAFRNTSSRTDAAREAMLVARKRAPDLAKKWLDQMVHDVDSDRANDQRGTFDDRTTRSAVLLQMAMQIVGENPEAAADLAMESLSDGVSFGFQEILLKIQEKDFGLAQRVFRAALARLRTAGMLDPNELLILNAYLYTPGRTMATNTGENPNKIQLAVGQNRPLITAAAQLNPALAVEFLNVAADLLITAPSPSTTSDPQLTARAQITAITSLIAKVAQVSPEKGAMLAQRLQLLTAEAQFTSEPSKAPEGELETHRGETASEYNERRVDYLEKLAEQEKTTLGRDIAYAKAALATTVDRYQRGWDIAGKIDDDGLREHVRNGIVYRAALYFMGRNDLDRAYDLTARNTDVVQRAASLVVGAQSLIKAKDTIRAGQWLQEARALIRRTDPEEGSVRVAFGVVSAYGKFDGLISFDALLEAVRMMNKTKLTPGDPDRVPLLRRFSGLEMPDFTYGTAGFSLKAAIGGFGPKDFEAVLDAINKITIQDIRGVATLELCRKYLTSAGPPPGS